MKMKKIYLAGPDVFRFDAIRHFNWMKDICKQYGFKGLSPYDNEMVFTEYNPDTAYAIFEANLKLIDQCDHVVSNIHPFRGVCVDDGTCVEIGYALKCGKKISGYSLYAKLELKEILNKFPTKLFDTEFSQVENFGLSNNLMIIGAIKKSGGILDLTFEDVIRQLK